MKTIKTILLWCVTAFFALSALAFFPSLSCIFLLVTALLFAPIKKIKALIHKLLPRKWLRIVVAAVLIVACIATVPTSKTEEEQPAQVSDQTASQVVEEAAQEEVAPEETPVEDTQEEATQEEETTPVSTPETTPEPEPEQKPEAEPVVKQESEPGIEYVLNTSSRKFHYPTCGSVDTMKEQNKGYHTGTRDELIAQGYKPCGNCEP